MHRYWKIAAHLVLVFLAFLVAYELRRPLPPEWWFTEQTALRVIGWASLFTALAAASEAVFRAERTAWRFVSARDALILLRSVTITSLLFVLIVFVADRGFALPRSVLVMSWGLSFAFLLGARVATRLYYDRSMLSMFIPSWWRPPSSKNRPLLIVGSMTAAEPPIRHLQLAPDATYSPVAIISPHRMEQGVEMHGVHVVGDIAQLEEVAASRRSKSGEASAILFLGSPGSDFGISPERIGQLRKAGHPLLRLQPVAREDGAGDRLQEMPLEEFLPRAPVRMDPGPLVSLIRGRRVLVTGAGGSIGSELARQLATLGCAHVALVDHSEFLLFEIDRELGGAHPGISRRALLANVRDRARIMEIFRQERPDIIFHAAALKHVALVENNPAEGVLTNVLGTLNTMEASIEIGAGQFVLISTDKAVAPTNVMGSTKRIAETLLQLVESGPTRLSAVRFGNVLGSAGSVVPIFRDQIAQGGPVTVTHPEVNRFFMTIPEAVQLVLHSTAIKAARIDQGPSKFLLEMGEPVRILELARQMILLSGKQPDKDVRIEFTGLKAGEKLTEALLDEGEEVAPAGEGIMEVTTRGYGNITLAEIGDLIQAARNQPVDSVKLKVQQMLARCCAPKL